MERSSSLDQEGKNSTNNQIPSAEMFYKHLTRSILVSYSPLLEFVLCVFKYINVYIYVIYVYFFL